MEKTLLFFLLLAYLHGGSQKPEFSFQSLVGLTNASKDQFQTSISRKGFKQVPAENDSNSYFKNYKKKSIEKMIRRYDQDRYDSVIYQTSWLQEFLDLNQELQNAGYATSNGNMIMNNVYSIYQKRNITIKPRIKKEEGKTLYSFIIEKKDLPQAKEIVYAEDLLKISSHEYLAAIFGANNVRKDVFYFSEKEVNKCSILFPNTSMQAIFIWNDEVNNRDISLLIIGGQFSAGSTMNYRTVEQSKWRTSNGIYQGMSLKELYQLNGSDIKFYGWDNEEGGFIVPEKIGNIDFKKTGVKLTCLDCNEDQYYSKSGIITSTAVLKENRRVFVSALVIAP
ncbi:hypothetical protein OCK74_17925 [Chitinophagaceae bacterium LB-8]|uniref:Uncharacterized protein n=1 Tax=Paraflavisolibacter caeni TaxID=2982496 RepID=A0A9X3BIA3_9BACT|nr:hypothetical protein [Paraflavisolibacter caeni]MCU7551002.1 hypothetical protein [Paraflavisolibacter caeni]